MLRVALVRTGSKYGPEYVEILQDMIRRNLPYGFKGTIDCFTDQPEQIEGVQMRPSAGFGGWWDKIGLMREGLWPHGDRIWYFDLDTCIVGPLDKLFQYDGKFAAIRDFLNGVTLQSCVMTWTAGELNDVMIRWWADRFPMGPAGDQAVVERYGPKWVALQDIFPKAFTSYRRHSHIVIPDGAAVVNFHGEPKPHEVKDGWVPYVWKVGGGTANELMCVCNTGWIDVKRNIEYACSLNRVWFGKKLPERKEGTKTILIVGGGPSLRTTGPALRSLAQQGHRVLAVNNAAYWCEQICVSPDYQIMMDARPEMVRMVHPGATKYFASQCHPSVTDKANFLFHAYADGVEALIPHGEAGKADAFIGGGSTAGLIAMSLAYLLGYRNIHLFGFDSSIDGDHHHAYAQKLNDNMRILNVVVGGKEYFCQPWMARQVHEYQRLAQQLVSEGCEITCWGEGLLQAIHAEMSRSTRDADLRAIAILDHINGIENPVGVEIGVSVAELSMRLLRAHPSLKLYMVDPYFPPDKDSSWAKTADSIARRSMADFEAMCQTAAARTEEFGARAVRLRRASPGAAEEFENGSMDFVFIDADHSYEGCSNDISAWLPKVKPGGWLCGHDYDNAHPGCNGVKPAVDDFVRAMGVELELSHDYTWFVRVTNGEAHYQRQEVSFEQPVRWPRSILSSTRQVPCSERESSCNAAG